MHLPISTPSAPAAMRLDSYPNQDEANNEINAWLSSGLQSYVEEGQRMRDAADGIPSTKTLAVTRTTTHAVDRYEVRYLPPSPEPSAATTHEQCRDNHVDVPPRVPDLLNKALSERPIIIKGNNHNIYINYGTGQQNINYSGPRGDRNNNDEEGDEDDGYNTDSESGDGQDNGQEYDSGGHQPGYSHDGRDDGYGGHTRRRDMTSYERQGSQPDLASADGSGFDEYSD